MHTAKRKNNSLSHFSLIELLVVIAMITITLSSKIKNISLNNTNLSKCNDTCGQLKQSHI